MSKPIPGKQYTTKAGDTLSRISTQAFGDSLLWPRIRAANQSKFKSIDPEEIPSGTIIIIPVLAEEEALRTNLIAFQLADKDIDELTILVDSLEIQVRAAKIVRTMDTGADGWTA